MSATPYQNLYDIDGLTNAIREATIESDRFGKITTEDFKRINQYAASLRKELEKINGTLINGGRPLRLFDDASGAEQIRALSQQVTQLTAQYNTQRRAIENMNATLQANRQAVSDARVQEAQYRTELAQGRVVNQGLRNDIARTTLEVRQLTLANRQARQATQAATGSYREAQERLKQLGNQIRSVEGGFQSTSRLQQARIAEYNKLNDALKKFDASMGNHQRNVGNYGSAIAGVTNQLKSLALSYISIQGALQLATASFNSNLRLDSTRASLEYTLGSADAASQKIDELRESARRLGLEVAPLIETYAKFSGAARASNFPLEQADKIFNSVSGAAARFHLTSDQLSGALLALQQMISKGTVQSEELRGQLGERLPGAFAIAARALGKTEMELGKLLQTGQVTAAELLPKLAIELDKTFSLDKSTKIDSLAASTNRLKSAFDNLIQGDGLTSFFKTFVDGWAQALDEVGRLFDNKKPLWDRIRRGLSFNTQTLDIQDNIQASQQFRSQNNINPIGTTKNNVVSALATQSLSDLDKLRKGYIDAAQKAADAVNVYRTAINKGELTSGGKFTLEQAEQNLKRVQADLYIVTEAYKLVQKEQKSTTTGVKELTDEQLTSIAQIRKRISDLSKLPGSATDGSAINNRIDILKQRLKDLTPSTKQAKEGFAELEEQLRNVNAQLEIAIIRDYLTHQGKESASTRALAEQYNKLGKEIERVNKLKTDALFNVEARQQRAQFGDLFPSRPATDDVQAPNLAAGQARMDYESTSAGLESLANDYIRLTTTITEQYRKRNITKQEFDRQMLQADETNTKLEYTLQKKLIDDTAKELEASGKKNTQEYRGLTRRRYELDKKYSDDRLALELRTAQAIDAIYQDLFSTIQDSANVIGGATGKLIGGIGDTLMRFVSAENGGTQLSDTDKLAAGLGIAGDAVGVYTELSINASKARMAQIEAEYQHELKLAGDNEEAKTIITNRYNEQVRQEQQKQARYQKAQAIAEIAINTAVAVTKTLGTTGFFGIPLAAIVGALGAVQLGLVLAQPIPQYAVGREGGAAEYAMVNENGAELIGQNGQYRIANGGKKGITRLNAGDEVKTASVTQEMFANGIIKRSGEIAANMGGAKAIYDTYVMTVASHKPLNSDEMADSVARGVGAIQVHQHHIDERGYTQYQTRVRERRDFNRSRNKL